MMNTEIKNTSLYYEICALKRLLNMGYITQQAYEGIIKIATEDYNSTLILPGTNI